ncbi:MAG: hypothetical protein JF603_06800 [Acidobacteria bacterium]|nr:hypothetical protein [Acidobacteriota bacterium]
MELMTFVRNQRDRVAAWLAIGLGVLALVVGWFGVSGTPFPAEQLPYVVTGGLGGLFLLGIGALLWLSADLRDEWRKLDAIEQLLRSQRSDAAAPPPASRRRQAA